MTCRLRGRDAGKSLGVAELDLPFYREYDLAWTSGSEQERKFQRVLGQARHAAGGTLGMQLKA